MAFFNPSTQLSNIGIWMSTRHIRLYFILFLTVPIIVNAQGDLTNQQPIIKSIQLGDKHNALRFYPDQLTFETGKVYKLIISNRSTQKHYFSANGMAHSVFTRKVQIVSSNQTLVEVKGTISEIEVYPGATAEWWFVPIKTITASSLHCAIKGHREAGMVGKITIK